MSAKIKLSSRTRAKACKRILARLKHSGTLQEISYWKDLLWMYETEVQFKQEIGKTVSRGIYRSFKDYK